jgi:undecaprenyl-diphosphatase
MAFPQWLNNIDTQLFLAINGSHSSFFDAFFMLFTSMIVWIPLYLMILYLVFKKYNQQGFWILIFLILAVVLSDQLSVLIKVMVHRLRPSHEPLLLGKVNLPTGEGGMYGFVSSHATNVFSFAFLMGYLTKNRRLFIVLLGWAFITIYSRVYVGVHYPLDVICGAILGTLIGWGIYKLLFYFDRRFQGKKIFYAGTWKNNEVQPALTAMLFIVVTLLVVSKLIVRYNIH